MNIKEATSSNKKKLLLVSCLIVAVILGFCLGLIRTYSSPETQTNNTPGKPYRQHTERTLDKTCLVKGKHNKNGEKVYYLPSDAFYLRITASKCFNSEEQAVKAGFKRLSQ